VTQIMDAGIAELRRCWSNSYPDAQLVADMSRGFPASSRGGRLAGMLSPAASAEAGWLAYSARRRADIRFVTERCRLGLIFLCHAPERVNDIIARRWVSISCAKMREFDQLAVLHFRKPTCNLGESRSSVIKRGRQEPFPT